MGRRAAVARVRSSHILKAMWRRKVVLPAPGSPVMTSRGCLSASSRRTGSPGGGAAACAGIGRSGQGDVEVLDGEAVGLARAYLKPADIDEGGVFAQGLKVF